MTKPPFQAKFDIYYVEELAPEEGRRVWQVDGTVSDFSNLGYMGLDVTEGNLIFCETPYNDIDAYRVKMILWKEIYNVSVKVIYLGEGDPQMGQPWPAFTAAITANLGEDVGCVPSQGMSAISEYLSNGIRNWNDSHISTGGEGTETAIAPSSEGLVAGDFVNLWDDSGVTRVRKAKASEDGYSADGYVKALVISGNNATVYLEGANDKFTGLTGGKVYFLSETPGLATLVPPNGAGKVVQEVGKSTSSTTINYEPSEPVVLA